MRKAMRNGDILTRKTMYPGNPDNWRGVKNGQNAGMTKRLVELEYRTHRLGTPDCRADLLMIRQWQYSGLAPWEANFKRYEKVIIF